MIVKELVEQLQQFNDNTLVQIVYETYAHRDVMGCAGYVRCIAGKKQLVVDIVAKN